MRRHLCLYTDPDVRRNDPYCYDVYVVTQHRAVSEVSTQSCTENLMSQAQKGLACAGRGNDLELLCRKPGQGPVADWRHVVFVLLFLSRSPVYVFPKLDTPSKSLGKYTAPTDIIRAGR